MELTTMPSEEENQAGSAMLDMYRVPRVML